MMYLKAHSGIVELFLLFIIFKIFLLFFNKPLLDKVRAKTKIVDMVLGLAVVVTGFLLLNARGWNLPSWLALKIVVAIASIPIAIVGFKKSSKLLAIVSVALMILAYLLGRYKGFI